jgi:hypothetical protein
MHSPVDLLCLTPTPGPLDLRSWVRGYDAYLAGVEFTTPPPDLDAGAWQQGYAAAREADALGGGSPWSPP